MQGYLKNVHDLVGCASTQEARTIVAYDKYKMELLYTVIKNVFTGLYTLHTVSAFIGTWQVKTQVLCEHLYKIHKSRGFGSVLEHSGVC